MVAAKPNKLHSGHIMFALARYFDWFRNMMMPEWEINGGRADLLFISRSGYATEIEIKISLSDWNADRDKEKWRRDRPHISRFFYAVPEALSDQIPSWVPDTAGIIAVALHGSGYPTVRIAREAKRKRSVKIPDSVIRHMQSRCYFRFWGEEMQRRAKMFRQESKLDKPR